VSDEPCGFDSRPFRSGLLLGPVSIDGVRGVTAAHEHVNLAAQGSTPAEHPRSLLELEEIMTPNVLELPTLVLNQHWQPVHVTSVARSLVLLWNDAARVVDPDDYQALSWADWAGREPADGERCIRSARLRLAVPEVITLSRYDRLPNTAVTFSRRNVAKRDHYVCQYCGAQPGAESITIDHIQPRSRGGVSTWTNCVAACERCNAKKGDRTPEQAGMKLRRRPVRPEWKPFYAAQGARVESWARFLTHEPALALA
jgi:5-methylcytosine-specific restriction endonuclease McrA